MQKIKLCSQIADTLLILIGVAVMLELCQISMPFGKVLWQNSIELCDYTVVTPFQLGISAQMSLLLANCSGNVPNHSIG